MNDEKLTTVEQVKQFLAGSEALKFGGVSIEERYRWIEIVLVGFKYHWLNRDEKGVIRRSIERMKQAIYTFFKKAYPKEYRTIETKMQLIVLKENNTQHFVNALNKAKELYSATVGKGKSELIQDDDWNESAEKLRFNPPLSPSLGGILNLGDTPRPPPGGFLDLFFSSLHYT